MLRYSGLRDWKKQRELTQFPLYLQFGKKCPYGGNAAKTIWNAICAIKANTDRPRRVFWKCPVGPKAVQIKIMI